MAAKANTLVPYVGPRPFEPKDQKIFFGRDRETSDLVSLIVAHSEVVLYSQSGAGKSSLINAALVPLLVEKKGFQVFQVTGLRGLVPQGTKLEEVPNIFVYKCLLAWSDDESPENRLASDKIPSFLEEQSRRASQESPAPRLLIFDQFEDFLIQDKERWQEREEFFRQVAEALEKDRMLRVLFVIKEDFLAGLDPYVRFLPDMLRTRYRLEGLRKDAALRAVEGPLEETDCKFKEGVASELVQKLLKAKVPDISGQMIEVDGDYVEPVQLQIVCKKLWESLDDEVKEITEEHLKRLGTVDIVDEALRNFYEDAVKAASPRSGVKEEQLRRWFDDKLITPAGTRGMAFRGPKDTEGIPNSWVDELEKEYIIRAETMGPRGHWYELTHDRLINPIQESNRKWFHDWDVNVEKERLKKKFRWGAFGVAVLFILAYVFHLYLEHDHVEERLKSFATTILSELSN